MNQHGTGDGPGDGSPTHAPHQPGDGPPTHAPHQPGGDGPRGHTMYQPGVGAPVRKPYQPLMPERPEGSRAVKIFLTKSTYGAFREPLTNPAA